MLKIALGEATKINQESDLGIAFLEAMESPFALPFSTGKIVKIHAHKTFANCTSNFGLQ